MQSPGPEVSVDNNLNMLNTFYLIGLASVVAKKGGVKMKTMNKKGQVFDNISALGVGIAGLAITLIVVFLILANVASNSQVTANNNASVAVDELQSAADDIPGWVPLVVIAVIGAILLSLVALFKGR